MCKKENCMCKKRDKNKKIFLFAMSFILGVFLLFSCKNSGKGKDADGIKVGILFSVSGTTAISEKSMLNAALLAIDIVNNEGGINGKKLIAITEDYASDPAKASEKVKKLILKDKVVATIGCYTSASRKAVLPVVEENDAVFIYPTYYEGEEMSKNFIYTGSTPNQQICDLIPWLIDNIGKKFYLIGSDYIYPVMTNKQAKALINLYGGEVVGEEYVPLGHSEFSSIIGKMKQASADIIFSDMVGDSVVAFYKQYNNFGMDSKKMPIVSTITDEMMVSAVGKENAVGHYSTLNYFESLDIPENKEFLKAYKEKYGKDSIVVCPAEAAYTSVLFLAEALKKASDYSTENLIDAFKGIELNAPQGKIKLDEENHHTWLYSRIGKTKDDGTFEIVYESKEAIHPEPWPKLIYPDGPPKN